MAESSNCVGTSVPFTAMLEVERKPVPVRVRVTVLLPTGTLAGVIAVMTGTCGLLIRNGSPVELPPPGAGLLTVMVAVPSERSAAAIVARSVVSLTNTVGRL